MFRPLLLVVTQLQYLLLSLTVTGIVFSATVLLPNISLLASILGKQSIEVSNKVSLLISLYGSIGTNFTFLGALYVFIISVLFGVNTSLFVYYVRAQQATKKGTGVVTSLGIGGLLSGFLGIGCAACGTFILTFLLGAVGAGSLLTLLPLQGEEFGLIGIGLLCYMQYILLKKIQAPKTCSI